MEGGTREGERYANAMQRLMPVCGGGVWSVEGGARKREHINANPHSHHTNSSTHTLSLSLSLTHTTTHPFLRSSSTRPTLPSPTHHPPPSNSATVYGQLMELRFDEIGGVNLTLLNPYR